MASANRLSVITNTSSGIRGARATGMAGNPSCCSRRPQSARAFPRTGSREKPTSQTRRCRTLMRIRRPVSLEKPYFEGFQSCSNLLLVLAWSFDRCREQADQWSLCTGGHNPDDPLPYDNELQDPDGAALKAPPSPAPGQCLSATLPPNRLTSAGLMVQAPPLLRLHSAQPGGRDSERLLQAGCPSSQLPGTHPLCWQLMLWMGTPPHPALGPTSCC